MVIGLGLAVTVAVIALLVWPVARIITRPVERLRRSALMIADGELSHRARPEGRDEIGELALAFNHMAERLETMIRAGRDLLANVSHELRSPPDAPQAGGGVCWKTASPEGDTGTSRRYLESIRAEIELMDDLLGRLLEWSRLEMRESQAEGEPVPLEPVIDEIVARYRAAGRTKTIGHHPPTRLESGGSGRARSPDFRS